jgi:FkbM family methyltransferase
MILPFTKRKPHKTREGKIVLTMKAHGIDTVIDIGANNGQTRDLLRAGGFEGDIISIEPLPGLQPVLQAGAARDPKWRVLEPLALGDKNEMCEINISEASDMSSILKASGELMAALPGTKVSQTARMPMKTLDTLYAELALAGRSVFIKMDAQGYEMNILRHGEQALAQAKGLQVEMSLFPLYEGETLYDEIIAFLKARGFCAHMLVETNFSRRLGRQLQVDGIFYKD